MLLAVFAVLAVNAAQNSMPAPLRAKAESATARQAQASACSSYVGQKVKVSDFEQVHAQLPMIAPRDAYESSPHYERRLMQAPRLGQEPIVIRRVPQHDKEGLSYNPDRQTLTIYPTAFGAGQINFTGVIAAATPRGKQDSFSSAVAFLVSAVETGQEAYEASNAFGATRTVTRSNRRVAAIWERPGKLGENQFLDVRAYGPLTRLEMAPSVARALIEEGSAALLFVPQPPYKETGVATLAPTFNSPRERHDTIDVIIADVRCGFLLDKTDTVRFAFPVR